MEISAAVQSRIVEAGVPVETANCRTCGSGSSYPSQMWTELHIKENPRHVVEVRTSITNVWGSGLQ